MGAIRDINQWQQVLSIPANKNRVVVNRVLIAIDTQLIVPPDCEGIRKTQLAIPVSTLVPSS